MNDDMFEMWNEMQVAAEARRQAITDELSKLAAWCQSRADGDHNPDTTMTMLGQKVKEIHHRLIKAGAKAIHEHRAATPR